MTEPESTTRRARRLFAQSEPPQQHPLSHLRADGSAHMVDVSEKLVTHRRAVAHATVVTRADVVHAVVD